MNNIRISLDDARHLSAIGAALRMTGMTAAFSQPQVGLHLIARVSSLQLIAVSGCAESREGEPTVAGLETARHDASWDDTSALRADIDRDGVTDLAALGREPGKIIVSVVRGSGEPPQLLSFGIRANQQDAICSEPATFAFESQAEPDEGLEGFRPSASCQGLRLSGGECDAIHLYWNHSANRFGWWRN